MSTILKQPKKVIHRKIQSTPAGDPVTVAEYCRRKTDLNREKDPLSPKIWDIAVNKAIDAGYIEMVECGGNYFIDWERYRDYIFRTTRRVNK